MRIDPLNFGDTISYRMAVQAERAKRTQVLRHAADMGYVEDVADLLREAKEEHAEYEAAAMARYEESIASGLSDAEAREDGWPQSETHDWPTWYAEYLLGLR